MTEKLLPYDRAIVPQETGYWCGPAVEDGVSCDIIRIATDTISFTPIAA